MTYILDSLSDSTEKNKNSTLMIFFTRKTVGLGSLKIQHYCDFWGVYTGEFLII
jgi:hypothetical protein